MAEFAHHLTLTASTVSTVTLLSGTGSVEVINRSGTSEIYFTTNGTTPTVGGDDCYVVPAGVMSYVAPTEGTPVVVNLISVGTPSCSVVLAVENGS